MVTLQRRNKCSAHGFVDTPLFLEGRREDADVGSCLSQGSAGLMPSPMLDSGCGDFAAGGGISREWFCHLNRMHTR